MPARRDMDLLERRRAEAAATEPDLGDGHADEVEVARIRSGRGRGSAGGLPLDSPGRLLVGRGVALGCASVPRGLGRAVGRIGLPGAAALRPGVGQANALRGRAGDGQGAGLDRGPFPAAAEVPSAECRGRDEEHARDHRERNDPATAGRRDVD